MSILVLPQYSPGSFGHYIFQASQRQTSGTRTGNILHLNASCPGVPVLCIPLTISTTSAKPFGFSG
jgi:hypothetical protein